ncbi:hypothetical protein JVU11DRAFT_8859 [Chiua virens]|nr:hypothetical protein JVU11DRAFT_8859 [Chiua virens]
MILDTATTQTLTSLEASNASDVLLARVRETGKCLRSGVFHISYTLHHPLSINRICTSKLTSSKPSLSANPPSSSSSSSAAVTQQFPTSALAVLHQYEANGHLAPMKSYTRIISALFNVQTCASSDPRLGRAAAHAQAWDLFAHMRYVAHPVPDAHLYALMIRACGSFSRPEPERALDLWTEMQENGVTPTKGAYEAVIRVCGRAGPEWLGEGMRLAREMGDRYSITGASGKGLWCALLEGCKRAGDLKKARWILAEAVRGSGHGDRSEDSSVDAEMMTHVFHTYASYKPPFRRETTRLVDDGLAAGGKLSTEDSQAEEILSDTDHMYNEQTEGDDIFPGVPAENVETVASFSRLPPQTPSDIIAEVQALFHRILQDISVLREPPHVPQAGFLVGGFAHVQLTPVLLNAYLSVFYRHASIETSREVFVSLFGKGDPIGGRILRPDEHTYVSALERCAIARVVDRHIAARWAADIWRRWEVAESDGLRDGKGNVGSFARLIEKAHSAMRRVLILSGDIDGALVLLRTFVSRYPPNTVLQPSESRLTSVETSPIVKTRKSTTIQLFAKPLILSTRTILMNPVSSTASTARPLVRLTSAVTPKDDRVPPIIAFSDVELLHTRLAEHGRTKELGYIKWVCMAYTNALKKRRDVVLKASPTRHEDEVD